MLPQNNQRKHRRGIGGLLFGVALVTLSIFIWLNRQYLVDSISFWGYQPTAAVAEIATGNDFTDTGKFIFYAVQPVVEGGRKFNVTCDRQEQNTAILGCYVANRIYIYDVKDSRLDGIKEVTAAHEMLHAVYDRLSGEEKQDVDRLVETEFEKLRDNPEFSERMNYYARTEPGERDNELHSIIGTEVASINPELESHYRKYFNDRSKIVGYHEKYNNVFTTLSDQAKALAAQLDELNKEIKTASAQYNTDAKQLNNDITEFNRRAESGDFTSQAQFNSERAVLVRKAASLATQRSAVNAMIDKYNQLKDEYNETVTQSNELYKSIDSSLAPAPKV